MAEDEKHSMVDGPEEEDEMDKPVVVYEDVPDGDEKELPCGWEDHLYESWRDEKRERQARFKSI